MAIASRSVPSYPSDPTAPVYKPRRSASSSAMTSIARILGAPVTLPLGKVTSRSGDRELPERAGESEGRRCRTREPLDHVYRAAPQRKVEPSREVDLIDLTFFD